MSIVSTVANYGGSVNDKYQNVRQFIVGLNDEIWIYKNITDASLNMNELSSITPANTEKPVYINNDLYVTGNIYVKGEINPVVTQIQEMQTQIQNMQLQISELKDQINNLIR